MVTDNSKTHINPLDIFDPNAPIPEQPFLSKYFYPATLTAVGVGIVCGSNFFSKKPMFAGIQKHFLGAGLGLILGFSAEAQAQKWNTRRDDMIYHYMLTHPEDFPPVERVKYRDVLEKWYPCR